MLKQVKMKSEKRPGVDDPVNNDIETCASLRWGSTQKFGTNFWNENFYHFYILILEDNKIENE